MPLPGDPHTTLLSIDGRVLYATQPNLGDVAVIAAKTKQILYKASVPGHPTLLTLDPETNMLYTANIGLLLFNTLLAKILPSAKQRLIPH
jgi:DNA-binding beta-propeller fold protein YncE